MIPFVVIAIIIALIMFGLGVLIKEWVIGAISGMVFVIVGIYLLQFGFLGLRDYLTLTFGIVMICTGFYIVIKAGLEQIQEVYGGLS